MVIGCEAAEAEQRAGKCFSQFGQRILDSDGLRILYAARDQSGRFEIAKGSRKHSLRNACETAAQRAVAMRAFIKS